ncbi:MAG: hypothetical protein JWR80_8023 [Bradyrhizobium sp.]|nr:hypothetical protein [Bradyrhizobium sp.]
MVDFPPMDIDAPGPLTDSFAATLRGAMKLGESPLATDGVSTPLGVDEDGVIVRGNPFAVNALDHGVKTTNTRAQNSAKLQALVTAIMATPTGGVILIPRGTYQFDPTTPVVFPKAAGKIIGLVGEGQATVLDVGTSTTQHAFYNGDPSPGSGLGVLCKDITFKGGSASTGIAWKFEYANAARFIGCNFVSMHTGVKASSSYAVRFSDGMAENVGMCLFDSDTHAHHLTFDHFNGYNVGLALSGAVVRIGNTSLQPIDNVVFRDSDFEGCYQIGYFTRGVTSLTVDGCYIEFTHGDPWYFGAEFQAQGFSWVRGWYALGDADWTVHHWKTGEFQNIRMWDQVVIFDADCGDVDVGPIMCNGGATIDVSALWKTDGITFAGGASSNVDAPIKYRKMRGRVYVRGQVDNIPGSGASAFYLPVGYRPDVNQYFPCSSPTTFGNTHHVIVGFDGNFVPSGSAGDEVRLDSISYATDPTYGY